MNKGSHPRVTFSMRCDLHVGHGGNTAAAAFVPKNAGARSIL